jgi:hypothetical protein
MSLFSRRFRALIVLALFLLSVGQAQAVDSASNAALQYWMALAQFPGMDAKEQQVLAKWDSTPLNAQADKLIDAGRNALVQLHRGSALKECDWALHHEDGFLLLLPHLGKSRDLARLALLRARRSFEGHEPGEALDDVTDALVLARHCRSDGIPIAVLVDVAIENQCFDLLEAHVGELSPKLLNVLQQRLAAMPAMTTLKESIATERKLGLEWLIAKLKDAGDDTAKRDQVVASFGKTGAEFRAAQQAAGGTPAATIEQLEALGSYYDKVSAIADLPAAEFRKRVGPIDDEFSKNPFGKVILMAYGRFYDKHLQERTRLTLLQAAIAIRLSTPEDQLKNFSDPAGDGPFVIEIQPDGFVLKSKLIMQAAPVTFTVRTSPR